MILHMKVQYSEDQMQSFFFSSFLIYLQVTWHKMLTFLQSIIGTGME